MAHLHFGFETVRNVSLSNSRCKTRAIRKRLKRQKKKGGKLLADLVKLVEIAISAVLGKGLAEFEVAFTIQSLIFSEINGVTGFLLVSTWADARGSRAIYRKNCQNLYVTFPDTYAVLLPGGEVTGRCWRPVRSSAL
jgi:hypothetical protein